GVGISSERSETTTSAPCALSASACPTGTRDHEAEASGAPGRDASQRVLEDGGGSRLDAQRLGPGQEGVGRRLPAQVVLAGHDRGRSRVGALGGPLALAHVFWHRELVGNDGFRLVRADRAPVGVTQPGAEYVLTDGLGLLDASLLAQVHRLELRAPRVIADG